MRRVARRAWRNCMRSMTNTPIGASIQDTNSSRATEVRRVAAGQCAGAGAPDTYRVDLERLMMRLACCLLTTLMSGCASTTPVSTWTPTVTTAP